MTPCQMGTGYSTGLDAFCGSDTKGHLDYGLPKGSGTVKGSQMFCVTAVYILLSCSVLESKTDPTCISCIHRTRSSQGLTWTLLYQYSLLLPRRGQGTCVHNKTTYSNCQQEGQYICFGPWFPP